MYVYILTIVWDVETICLLFRLSGMIADYDLFVQFIYELNQRNVTTQTQKFTIIENEIHLCV